MEEGYEMFDLSHVEHAEYILNGAVVVGRATSVDEDQGLVFVGLKGSLGAQGQRREEAPRFDSPTSFLLRTRARTRCSSRRMQ